MNQFKAQMSKLKSKSQILKLNRFDIKDIVLRFALCDLTY